MVYKLSHSKFTLTILVVLFFIPLSYSETKKLKRPKSSVKISSDYNFGRESFDLYDKVYKYDGYAEAGKQALINVYKIDGTGLTPEGKGEREPPGDNATTEGKAQNRRVEFIKQ